MIQRRALLIGLGSMFAAPAIVRASSIMPVRSIASWKQDGLLSSSIIVPSDAEIVVVGFSGGSYRFWDDCIVTFAQADPA